MICLLLEPLMTFNKNLNISRMRGNISKMKTPFFFCSIKAFQIGTLSNRSNAYYEIPMYTMKFLNYFP